MESQHIDAVERWAQLAEKYGLALILAIVLLIAVLYILRLFIDGKLVSRDLLDRAEEDRDELAKAIHEVRAPLEELREVVKNLKKDEPRGG